MADSSHDGAPANGEAVFVAESYLTYFVPHATNDSVDEALETCALEGQWPQALFKSIKKRDCLFLDELVDVYMILKTPYQSDACMRSYLDRLVVALEARIVNGLVVEQSMTEYIYRGTVLDVSSPLAILHDPEMSDSSGADTEQKQDEGKTTQTRQTFFVWKLPVYMTRPRVRLQDPAVAFFAAASLKPVTALAPTARIAADGQLLPVHPPIGDEGLGGRVAAGYLRSREPSGLNLLASFGGDPDLAGVEPRLSAQRVSLVAPASSAAAPPPQPLLLRGDKYIDFGIYPVAHARVRFARPTAVPASSALVAIVEVDFTPFFECESIITDVALSMPSGTVTDMNTAEALTLPVFCVARDHFTFMYRLTPLEHGDSQPPQDQDQDRPRTTLPVGAVRALQISIAMTVLIEPGVCTPVINMSWETSLDFTLPVNPGFGTALMPQPSLQRAHRPSQLSIDGMSSFMAPAISQPDALPSLEAPKITTEATIPDLGITMTFIAPTHEIYAGESFTWTVFIVNRGSLGGGGPDEITLPGEFGDATRRRPRRLQLVAIPKQRRNDMRVLRPPPEIGPTRYNRLHDPWAPPQARDHGGNNSAGTGPVAAAVLDENVVHAMQRSSLVDSTDVICLSSSDTRVGPLSRHACNVIEMKFMALCPGVVGVEAIRVIDLDTQEHVDVRDLPTMFIDEGTRPKLDVEIVEAQETEEAEVTEITLDTEEDEEVEE